jgi:hypothetical protein
MHTFRKLILILKSRRLEVWVKGLPGYAGSGPESMLLLLHDFANSLTARLQQDHPSPRSTIPVRYNAANQGPTDREVPLHWHVIKFIVIFICSLDEEFLANP